jgi:hypothetical protein
LSEEAADDLYNHKSEEFSWDASFATLMELITINEAGVSINLFVPLKNQETTIDNMLTSY